MNELNPEVSRATRNATSEKTSSQKPALPALGRSEQKDAASRSGNSLPVAQQPRSASVADAEVGSAVTALNDYVQAQQRDLRFALDSDTGRPIVRVLDSNTQEVIRQIPNEVALRLARNVKAARDLMANDPAATQPTAEGYGNNGGNELRLLETKA
ncbi:MAG: flagellar protein FlaG [Pseudomonadota bacterium]